MRCYLQWTLRDPTDWIALDIDTSGARRRVWERLPTRTEPTRDELGGLDNTEGWPFDLDIQGVTFGGQDHYALRPLAAGLEVTTWNDDPDDWPPGTRQAQVWTFLEPAPDPDFGGAVNTRQTRIVYAEQPELYVADKRTTIRPWSEFVLPASALTRHGVWVTQEKLAEHHAVRTRHNWREWVTP